MAENKPLLSAEEIEALASGLEDGSIDTTSGYNLSMPVRKHDLAAEDSSLGVMSLRWT